MSIKNGRFGWDSSKEPLLNDINLEIGHGSLVAVVGRLGSGKSSVLSAITGEMHISSGCVKVNVSLELLKKVHMYAPKCKRASYVVQGQLAIVSQQAWIMNCTLRENVLFGNSYDKERYETIIDACCLKEDLAAFPAGDLTEIGERVNRFIASMLV